MNINITEKELIYLLNSLNVTLRFLTYHYQIYDIKEEMKRYFNYDNYVDDYNNLVLFHRILSIEGNKQFYGKNNDIFFIGQKDFLCTKEKDFKILENSERYKKGKTKEYICKPKLIFFKLSKFNFFQKNIDKYKKIV